VHWQTGQYTDCQEIQAAETSWEIPQIRMRQTQENCWEVVLTEEERELIDEFLEI